MSTELENVGPQVRADLEWRPMADGQIVATTSRRAHLALTADEFEFLQALDGSHPAGDLIEKWGSDTEELLDDFGNAGLLVGSQVPEDEGVSVTKSGIEFAGFGRLVARLHSYGGRHLLTKPGAGVVVAIIVAGALVLGREGLTHRAAENAIPGPLLVLMFSVAGIVASVIHESAHALVIHDRQRQVGSGGIGFYWGALAFYVDATDALLLPKKARLLQVLAGPAADALLASLLAISATALPGSSPWRAVLIQISVLLWIDVLVNLCPVLELDGYWAVADWLDRPNLRAQSHEAILRLFRHGDITSWTIACYGLVSLSAGLALMALSAWLWITVYADLVVETWHQGAVGKAAVAVWLGPTVLGLGASAAGYLKSVRSRPRAPEQY